MHSRQQETARWTESPAAPAGSGAEEVRSPGSRWTGKIDPRKQSEWNVAVDIHVNNVFSERAATGRALGDALGLETLSAVRVC